MWRGEVRRGRAGHAFDFGEPGVLDGATAKSLAAGRHGPRQVGQIVKTKPLRWSCLRILHQSLEPREPALQATVRLSRSSASRGACRSRSGAVHIGASRIICGDNSLRRSISRLNDRETQRCGWTSKQFGRCWLQRAIQYGAMKSAFRAA